jgi:predicted DNA-binding protein
MSASTTIRVPIELRDRLADRARRSGSTLAGELARVLDAADDALGRDGW